jgi:hypothetical protein
MPGPGNNKRKVLKKPATVMHTAAETPAVGTTDVPINISTCKGMCLAPINAFHCATDKTKALHGFWEIVFSLGSLDKFKEGKEYGLEEGKKSGLEEEGDFNRMFNQGARQGKADERSLLCAKSSSGLNYHKR